jgi:hypothetical protein
LRAIRKVITSVCRGSQKAALFVARDTGVTSQRKSRLNCPECGGKTKSLKKRIKKNVSIGSPSSIAEFIAVILFISAFIYPEAVEHIGLVILVSIALALLGHDLRFTRIRLEYCKACKKEFPINES